MKVNDVCSLFQPNVKVKVIDRKSYRVCFEGAADEIENYSGRYSMRVWECVVKDDTLIVYAKN